MTETLLSKAFAENGLVRFGSVGDTFDPNLHEALFQYAAGDGVAPGAVGQVLKAGYSLKGRVVRPAQVGTASRQ